MSISLPVGVTFKVIATIQISDVNAPISCTIAIHKII